MSLIPTRRPLLVLGAALLLAGCGAGEAAPEGGSASADSGSVAAADSASARPAASASDARAKAPPQIRGLYLNAYAAASRTRLPKLIAIADSTEINAFVIDVKDERGIRYRSQVALAMELSTPAEVTIRDLKALVDSLKAHQIYTMARIVLFKDPILSKAKPEWSVRKPDGSIWTDKAGNTWVSPWDENVWDYNLDIAEEVARAGFHEIQFDYVRFAEPYKSLPPQVHPKAKGDRTDAIAAFLNEAKRRLHPLGVTVTADVFGLSPNDPKDVNIGQQWETISATTDHILPMMYPSHYLSTHLPGVPKPDLMPYETLYKSAGMAVVRSRQMEEAGVRSARIIPWLQAFSATWLGRNHQSYGPQQLRDQKRGVYEVGLEDWVLWHPGSKYEHILGGLDRTMTSQAKSGYAPPQDVVAMLKILEAQGARQAREKAAEQARGRTTDAEAAQAARTGAEEPKQ